MTETTTAPETTAAPPAPASSDWTAALTPDTRAQLAPKSYANVEELAKAYVSLERTLGGEKIPLPGKDAVPEAWDRVYARLGRPATPADYDLSGFKAPDNVPWNGELQQSMVAEMHAAGLNSRQATRLLSRYAELAGDAGAAAETAAEQASAALRKEWGGRFDTNLDLARRAARGAFGDDFAAVRALRLADGSFLLDSPLLARAFARLGAERAEDGDLPGAKHAAFDGDAVDARQQITRLEADERFRRALLDRGHPEHAATLNRRSRLYATAYPAEKEID